MSPVSTRWSDEAFTQTATAPATGPFPQRPFLEAWWRHEAGGDRLALVSTDRGALALRESGGRILFVGDADVTDYHSPLGDPGAAIDVTATHFSGRSFSLDSLPEEAATALHAALDTGGHGHRIAHDGATMVLELPGDPESWLAGLLKKERHEVRRKRRRFVEALGEPRLEQRRDAAAVSLFAGQHRMSSGDKGGFMTSQREAFFADLVDSAGASVDVLTVGGEPVATGFGFDQRDAYYLYNSAYEPEASAASPGIVLLTLLIERLITAGVPRLDLLKGDEPYKFRLGASPRPLYRIEGTFR